MSQTHNVIRSERSSEVVRWSSRASFPAARSTGSIAGQRTRWSPSPTTSCLRSTSTAQRTSRRSSFCPWELFTMTSPTAVQPTSRSNNRVMSMLNYINRNLIEFCSLPYVSKLVVFYWMEFWWHSCIVGAHNHCSCNYHCLIINCGIKVR